LTKTDRPAEDAPERDALSESEARSRLPLGPKGARTRQRIMAATEQLLRQRPLGDVPITEIARAAEIRQPNFYTYFAGVEDVIFALGEELVTLSETLHVHLTPDWSTDEGFDHAVAFVEASTQLWGERHIVLTLVNTLADSRRGAFAVLRVRQMRGVFKAFERKVREAQAAGLIDPHINPRLVGYECVGMVRAVSARFGLLLDSGFSRHELIDTSARILYRLVTGRNAPPPA
jgi:AcrR family transcriptional regulator